MPTLYAQSGPVPSTSTGVRVESGTYTPVWTPNANVTSILAARCLWTLCGNVVHISGNVRITPTLPNVDTYANFTIPFPADLSFADTMAGVGAGGFNGPPASIFYFSGPAFYYKNGAGSAETFVFTLMYLAL